MAGMLSFIAAVNAVPRLRRAPMLWDCYFLTLQSIDTPVYETFAYDRIEFSAVCESLQVSQLRWTKASRHFAAPGLVY